MFSRGVRSATEELFYFILEMGLLDVPIIGGDLTWSNNSLTVLV